MPYHIEYSPDTEEHLRKFSERDQRIILDTIDRQLRYQPTLKTKNRKPMRPNPLAPWELRIGKFRVYYDVGEHPEPVVFIRAIGVKEHNIVRIGGKVIEL
jgi:mRNA-degrading endonuclease RelE of RelBE toxin-antitoxin system